MSQAILDTNQLLELCQKGDERARIEIYNRYYKAMYNTAVRIVKDNFEAEDIMQESFLKAFTKLHTFKGEVTFGAWLKKIVVNDSIYHFKKIQKKNEITLDRMIYRVEDTSADVYKNDVSEKKAQKVLEAMSLLKDNYRVSLTLYLIEGYDYEEISEILHISNANCRTMISRAKESLRKKLGSYANQ